MFCDVYLSEGIAALWDDRYHFSAGAINNTGITVNGCCSQMARFLISHVCFHRLAITLIGLSYQRIDHCASVSNFLNDLGISVRSSQELNAHQACDGNDSRCCY